MKDKTIHNEQVESSAIRYTEYPMVRYLVVFVLGLICVVLCKDFSLDNVHIFNIIIIISVGIYIFFHKIGLFYVLTFLTGFLLMNHSYTPIPHSLEGKIIPAHFAGTIKKIEKESHRSINCILDGTIKIVKHNGVLSDEQYSIRLISNISGNYIPYYLKVGANIESIMQIQFPKSSYFPTELNSKQVLIAKDIHAFSSLTTQNIVVTSIENWVIEGNLHNWRNHVETTLMKVIAPEYLPLFLGMLFDKTTGIEEKKLELLGNFGLIHILSASGTHVLVITIMCWISLFMIRSHIVKTLVLGIFLILFVYVTGVQISAFRAALMSFTVFIIPHISRTIRPLNLLAFSTIVLLIYQPSNLFSYSFYFSTTAIFGIYLCYSRMSTLLKLGVDKISLNFIGKKFLNNVLIPSISLSLSAGLITNILGSLVFYKFSLSSIIGNTVFLFFYLLAFLSSIVTYIFSFISDKLFYFSGTATSFFLHIANSGMEQLEELFHPEISGYSIWIVAIFLGFGILYCIATKEFKIFVLRCFVVLLCFPLVKSIAQNLPYQIKDDTVYRFPSATLLPILQTKDTITYFLNIEPKSSQYSIEQINRFLPLSQKKILIVHNTDLPSGPDYTLKNISTMKISKHEQFLLYKYYLHKKTSQSRL